MKYGYARVSTTNQDLEVQLQLLEKENCHEIFKEKITGTKNDRPQFQAVLSILQEGDTLVVTKLDRFARSTEHALKTIRELFDKGIRIHVLNMGMIENTPTGRLILTIMSGFAEFERDMIVERTQEGKAIARKNPDFKEGRPKKFSKLQINHALELLKIHSYKEVEAMTGISRSTLMRARREEKSLYTKGS
jgi:DNA invertase Pin-like site-specific DNA recombinase